MIYLDNSATTRVDDEVLKEMNLYHSLHYGNPSSLHKMGLLSEKAVNKARIQVSSVLGVQEHTVYFVSGGTEANNMAIMSAVQKNKWLGNKIITSKIEHPSVLEVMKILETKGFEVCYLNVDKNGLLNTKQLEEEMTPQTILVSIMKVNNEVGVIQDLKKISEIAKKISSQCIVHSDCVQAFGKVELSPRMDHVDVITFSGHKFHGPKGIGGIYIDPKCALKPMIYGGGQEKGLRSGTENVPGIVGMGLAAELQAMEFEKNCEHIEGLKRAGMEMIQSEIEGVHFNSLMNENFAPHILNVSIEDVKSEILLHLLEKNDIFVSSGSACSSRKRSQSHVLKSMGLSGNRIEGSLRISFSKYNTLDEVQFTIKVLKDAVNSLRKFIRR